MQNNLYNRSSVMSYHLIYMSFQIWSLLSETAAAAAVTSGHYTDNKAPRYTRLQSSHMSLGITEPKGFPVLLGW